MTRMHTALAAALAPAMMITGVVALPALAAPGDQAGVAAAVRGEVRQVAWNAPDGDREAAIGRLLAGGDPVMLGDRIDSGPQGGLQIMLLDQTVFTLGPDSSLVIDEFVYDPESGSGEMAATMLRGAFRFISGRIAGDNPENLDLRTPHGQIGVRGTSVLALILPALSEIILTGVGPGADTGDRPSRILATANGITEEVFRAGFRVMIRAGQAPDSPEQAPPGRIAELSAMLAPPPGSPGSGSGGAASLAPGGGSLAGLSGASTADALDPAGDLGEAGALVAIADGALGDSIQAGGSTSQVTLVGELQSITSGTVATSFATIPLSSEFGTGNGQYNTTLTIDFGSRQLVSAITGDFVLGGGSPTMFSFNDTFNYAADPSGDLVQEDFFSSTDPGFGGVGANEMEIRLRVRNDPSTGEIAAFGDAYLRVVDPKGENALSGAGSSPIN